LGGAEGGAVLLPSPALAPSPDSVELLANF